MSEQAPTQNREDNKESYVDALAERGEPRVRKLSEKLSRLANVIAGLDGVPAIVSGELRERVETSRAAFETARQEALDKLQTRIGEIKTEARNRVNEIRTKAESVAERVERTATSTVESAETGVKGFVESVVTIGDRIVNRVDNALADIKARVELAREQAKARADAEARRKVIEHVETLAEGHAEEAKAIQAEIARLQEELARLQESQSTHEEYSEIRSREAKELQEGDENDTKAAKERIDSLKNEAQERKNRIDALRRLREGVRRLLGRSTSEQQPDTV